MLACGIVACYVTASQEPDVEPIGRPSATGNQADQNLSAPV
jgi:hypothetical protein